MSGFKLKIGPATEPLPLADAKAHLRAGDDEDALITALIQAARETVEAHTGRPLITQTWLAYRDAFNAARIELKPGVISITTVKYQDTDNAQQTLATSVYELDPAGLLSAVRLQYGQAWPSTLGHPDGVVIEFICGYGAAAAVPQALKQAMLLIIGHLYEHREEVVVGTITSQLPMASEFLLNPFRIPVVG